MNKKGFTAFDMSAAVNSASSKEAIKATPKVTAPKLIKEKPLAQEKVQRAIYFPKSVDDDLRKWAFEENTQVTKIVVEAVRQYGAKRK